MEAAVTASREMQAGDHMLCELNHTGDYRTIWNPRAEDEVEAARSTFKSLKDKGYVIYRVDKEGEKGEVMHKFDPAAEKLIAVPRVVGG